MKKVSPSGNDLAADGVRVVVEFATPMDPAAVRAHVTLTPHGGAAQPLELSGDGEQVKYSWSGDLETNTEYEVRVDGGLKDAFGQVIAGETKQAFNVGDASPRLRTQRGIYVVEKASGKYPVYTRNLPAFELRCARVPEAKLVSVLTGPANYDAWWDATPEKIDYEKLGLRARHKTVKPDAARNRWHDASVELGQECGAGQASGVYVLELTTDAERDYNGEAKRRERRSLASVTDLGLLAKVGNASSLVWVVRLSTGEPVASAAVKIRDLNGRVRFSGRSDADGVVSAPGASKLVGVKPAGNTNSEGGDEEGEGEGDWADTRARRVIVTAQDGEDLAVLDTNWNNGIQIWNFAVTEDRRGGDVRVRGFLHSDRGLYRPGDTVHVRGLARVVSASGAMALPRKRKVHVVPAAHLRGEGEGAAQEHDRAFAHYVLAALGKPEPGSLVQLFEHRARLPLYGKAFLARGLFKAGNADMARTVIAELVAAIPGTGTAIIRETERGLGYYWSSDLRTTALVLSALLEISPNDPGVGRLQDALVAARVDGRWSSTQENLYSLVALAGAAKRRAAAGDAVVTVRVGDGAPEKRTVRAGAVERLRIPLAKVAPGAKVTLDGGARELFFAARVHVERPLDGAAADRGLGLAREYLDPDTNQPIGKIRLGQTIKVRLTVRSRERRAHVAVVDRLPAGFEPVLTRFKASYAGEDARPAWGFWWWREQTAWQNLDLRDDRAQLFADVLVSGQSQQEYLVRATTIGSFAAPPVTAEAMYEPAIAGRSAAGKVVVEP